MDSLNIMEAYVSLMKLENVRILKEMRNSVNRKVNCETANISKTVNAAVKQIEDIRLIQKMRGLDDLPAQLREMALLRLEYPDAPLKELEDIWILQWVNRESTTGLENYRRLRRN